MAARVGLLLRALPLLLWGGLDAQLSERGGQELRREAEVKDACGAERGPRARRPSRTSQSGHPAVSSELAICVTLSLSAHKEPGEHSSRCQSWDHTGTRIYIDFPGRGWGGGGGKEGATR